MGKLKTFIVAFLFCNILVAQTFDVKNLDSMMNRGSNLNNLLEIIDDKYPNTVIVRDVFFNTRELICFSNVKNGYEIYALQDTSKVFLLSINKIRRKRKSIYFYYDQSLLDSYILNHKNAFNSDIKADSFKFFKTQEIGFCCYAMCLQSDIVNLMSYYVKNNDDFNLINMMKSYSLEEQVCGAMGLLIMEKNGLVLENDVLEIIDLLKNLMAEVKYCSGCLYGRTFQVQELLSDDYIDSLNVKYFK